MNRFKGIICFAAAFVIVSVVIYISTGNGKLAPFQEFRSSEGRFTVLMPGKPEVKNEAVDMPFGKVNTITYMAGSGKIGCIVSYSYYPELLIKSTDPQKQLELAKEAAVKDAGGRLTSETNIDFHGLPATEFRIEVPGKLFTAARYILASPRFYEVVFFAPTDKGHERDISKFFDSFKIDGVK
jgi:hypothetical protein